MEKIVFFVHSYHKKTKLCDFILEYLRGLFDVEVIYDEEWETGEKVDWSIFDDRYKAVIIFFRFPSEKENLKKIANKNSY